MANQGFKSGKTGRFRGFELVRRVYAELYEQLGDFYSPAELLRAAQAIIDVANEEYSLKKFQDGIRHPGYYSHDVDMMIRENPWWLMSHELRCDNLADERFNYDWDAKQRLKALYNPDGYYHRG